MKKGSLIGFLSVCVISFGTVISILFYERRRGEKYSLLNDFVSELGEKP